MSSSYFCNAGETWTSFFLNKKNHYLETSLEGRVGLIPAEGTKTPHAKQCGWPPPLHNHS